MRKRLNILHQKLDIQISKLVMVGCERNSVHFKLIRGESGFVCENTTNKWINSKLPSIITEFKLCDIYNADEFELFFRLKPTKTFIANKNNLKSGKLSNIDILDGIHMLGSTWNNINTLIIQSCFKKAGV